MRGESLALRRGDRKTVLADADVFAYERTEGDESITIALNFSEQPQRREIGSQVFELGPLGSKISSASSAANLQPFR
jgi:hypothetical protein